MKKAIWFVFCAGLFVQGEVFASEWYNAQHVFGPNELPKDVDMVYTDMYGDAFCLGTVMDPDSDNCSVRIWRYDGRQWNFEQELVPSGLDENKHYFYAVLGDDICIIHSVLYGRDTGDGGADSGKLHVFEFDGDQWIETQVITNPYDRISSRILGLDQDVFVMVGDNCVLVYRRGESGWEFEQRLVSFGDTTDRSFGLMCDIEGDICVVAAQLEQTEEGMGVVYVYHFDGIQWNPLKKISGFWPKKEDCRISYMKVVLEDGKCAIGVPGRDCEDIVTGKVMIYDCWNWELEQVLVPENDKYDSSGFSVFLRDGLVGVNSGKADGTADISLYRYNGSVWQEDGRIPTGEFGPVYVAHDDGKVIVASYPWKGHDPIVLRLDAWEACPLADVTGDCFVDLADFSVLASEWLTGFEPW